MGFNFKVNILYSMKKVLSALLIMTGTLIVIQGLLFKQMIPLEPFLLLTGVSSNYLKLFIIPILIFSIKFIYLICNSCLTLLIERRKNIGKKPDPDLPSARILGGKWFNVDKDLMSNFYSPFISLWSDFWSWVILFILALIITGLYIHFGLIENNREGILPLLLDLITGFSLILIPLKQYGKALGTAYFSR